MKAETSKVLKVAKDSLLKRYLKLFGPAEKSPIAGISGIFLTIRRGQAYVTGLLPLPARSRPFALLLKTCDGDVFTPFENFVSGEPETGEARFGFPVGPRGLRELFKVRAVGFDDTEGGRHWVEVLPTVWMTALAYTAMDDGLRALAEAKDRLYRLAGKYAEHVGQLTVTRATNVDGGRAVKISVEYLTGHVKSKATITVNHMGDVRHRLVSGNPLVSVIVATQAGLLLGGSVLASGRFADIVTSPSAVDEALGAILLTELMAHVGTDLLGYWMGKMR